MGLLLGGSDCFREMVAAWFAAINERGDASFEMEICKLEVLFADVGWEDVQFKLSTGWEGFILGPGFPDVAGRRAAMRGCRASYGSAAGRPTCGFGLPKQFATNADCEKLLVRGGSDW